MSTVACIFARAGSKGMPNKNIQTFSGKPLISWAVELALQVKQIDEVYVSTDSKEIAEIARIAGATVPFIRPSELATDTSPEWHSWQHFLKFLANRDGTLPEVFLSLPVTSPLRSIVDVENCLQEFKRGRVDFVVGITASERNPYFNMVKKKKFCSLLISKKKYHYRQSVPQVYNMTTICFVISPETIRKSSYLFDRKVFGLEVPKERSVDIDDIHDFNYAQFLKKNI